jgi:uncharacterized protein YndB with AHSA1/START domain
MTQGTLANVVDREITDTRIVNAPRELLWKVWTEPAHITQWWGPNGFTNTTEKMNVRPGGEWTHVMHGPDGRDYPNRIVYREVVEPERLVFDHISSPNHRTTVTFEDLGDGKTKLTFVMIFDTSEDKRKVAEEYRAVEGLSQTLGRLQDYLTKVG